MGKLVVQEIEKYVSETFMIGGDITLVKETGEIITLSGSSVSAVDKKGVASTIIDDATLALAGDNLILKARLSGGTIQLSPYIVTFYMKTSLNNLWGVRFEVTVI